MRLSCLLALTLLLVPGAFAAPFALPAAALTDDIALGRAMPGLARQLGADYRDEDRERYLDTVFRLQTVAGDHAAAIESLRALRALRRERGVAHAEVLFVQYEIAATAQARLAAGTATDAAAVDPAAVDAALRQAFETVYRPLDDRPAYWAATAFRNDLSRLDDELHAAMAALRRGGEPDQAALLELVRKYQVRRDYGLLLPRIDALVAEDDARRYRIDRSLLIRSPDGARIAAIGVRPRALPGRQTTLLGFTIYAVDDWAYDDAKRAAAYGYAGVVAYSRGKGRSPGPVAPYEHDGKDAAAVIDWIARQPWSDGRVGMYGSSYNGFAAWAAAKRMPRALKALMTSASAAPGIDVPMQGNVFLNFIYPWPHYVGNGKALDDATYGDTARWRALDRDWYRGGRPYRELERIDGRPNPIFRRWLDHPSYDAYWQRMIPYGAEFARIRIPVLATTGYFDGAQVGALYYFDQHTRHDPRADHTLLIGPYEHLAMQFGVARTVQGYAIDPVADIDLRALRYQWFDHVFKGAPKPALLKDRINYQLMGANTWLHAPTLEAMHETVLGYHLRPAAGDGPHRLEVQAPAGDEAIEQTVDLAERGDADYVAPPLAINAELDRRNGLVFASAPFERPLTLAGLFSGRLAFVANKRDLDLSVTLYEQFADGRYFQLAAWLGRASYVHERGKRRLLQPGRPTVLSFRSENLLGRQLQPGSRLVAVLAVSKQPDRQINYGSGRDVSAESIADAGEPLRIRWSGRSRIDIPIWR
ncbi:CocE/NonD family hydrolase [Chitinimonas koreensis]|uniref:CocE/NonD family hydrolase n=1 Tax=Chitinimonas koreensis TaxID=356302 RepID=UPI00040FDA2A|nr:CocE/NonD family hydrolase [Chitinimonas koreensis]QNM97071.1 CocE/NonD family hydrolase [Chitinimonas koreensis]